MTMIELKREDSSEGLGITVTGYRTADGRYVAMPIMQVLVFRQRGKGVWA